MTLKDRRARKAAMRRERGAGGRMLVAELKTRRQQKARAVFPAGCGRTMHVYLLCQHNRTCLVNRRAASFVSGIHSRSPTTSRARSGVALNKTSLCDLAARRGCRNSRNESVKPSCKERRTLVGRLYRKILTPRPKRPGNTLNHLGLLRCPALAHHLLHGCHAPLLICGGGSRRPAGSPGRGSGQGRGCEPAILTRQLSAPSAVASAPACQTPRA